MLQINIAVSSAPLFFFLKQASFGILRTSQEREVKRPAVQYLTHYWITETEQMYPLINALIDALIHAWNNAGNNAWNNRKIVILVIMEATNKNTYRFWSQYIGFGARF